MRKKLLTIKVHEAEKKALKIEADKRNTKVGTMLLKPFRKILDKANKQPLR